jgi:signal transduction histidine kinase
MSRPALLRPLDRLPTIRWKLGAVIVFAVAVTIAIMYVSVGLALHSEDRFRQQAQLRQQARTIAAVGFNKHGLALKGTLQRAIRGQDAKPVVFLGADRIIEDFPLPKGYTAANTAGGESEGEVGHYYFVGVPVYRDGTLRGAVFLAGRAPGAGVYGTLRGTAAFVYHHLPALLFAGAGAAIIALGLARLLARGMTQPLRDMANAAERLGRGDYSERVPVTSRDELGRTAETFNQMATELENMERLRRDLVANVSHELKTPISALRAHLENILDGVEEPTPATIAMMLQQSERLGRLVEQLLDLSKLESGSIPLEREPVSLVRVVDRVINEVRLGRAGGARVLNLIPNGFPQVMGSEERIHQVLFNLIDNALRFTPAGGRVQVSAVRQDGWCEVSVEDTGPGVPEEHRPYVFERFYRVDPSRSRSDGGTGIGLTIAKSVVEAHGGKIWVDRSDEGGAAFRFTLPLAEDPVQPADSASGPLAAAEETSVNERTPVRAEARRG